MKRLIGKLPPTRLIGELARTVPRKARLYGIEAIRGVAATTVVLYHVARHVNQFTPAPLLTSVTQFGHAGVDLFFVISGFIILYVHYDDIGQPARWGRYAERRFSRVMPIYWIALCITVTLMMAGGHAIPFSKLLWSATLLPSNEQPLLGVAWTLQYEVIFYAIFCVLILHRVAGLTTLATWFVGILANCSGWLPLGDSFILPSMLSAYNLEFFMGMAVAFSLRSVTIPRSWMAFALGLALFALAAAAEDFAVLDGYAPLARLIYGIPSTLLVMGIVEAERSGRLHVPSWLRYFGGTSYSIYLFHFIFIGIAWKIWIAAGLASEMPIWVTYTVLVCAALAGGVTASRLMEQPLLRLMRAYMARPTLARLS